MSTPSPTTSTQTLVITPGQTAVIPAGATITSLILDGSISVTSSCDNLPEPSNYACGVFYIIIDEDENEGHSMDEKHTVIDSLTVGNKQFAFGTKIIVDGDNPGTLITTAQLNAFIPSSDQPLFKFTNVTRDSGPDKRQPIYLYFKVPEDLIDTVEMKVSNFNSIQYYKNWDTVTCGTYPYPEAD